MREFSLFACLPGLTTDCLLQTLLKKINAFGSATEQPLLPPPPPSEEVFPSEVCFFVLSLSHYALHGPVSTLRILILKHS